MSVDPGAHSLVTDEGTLRALERLDSSRLRLRQWTRTLRTQKASSGGSWFQPRSATMRAVMSVGKMRLPWLRWAVPAFMMFKSLRRRR